MCRTNDQLGDDLASVVGEDLVCHLVTTILTDSDVMVMTLRAVRWKGCIVKLVTHWHPEWETQHWADVDHVASEFLQWDGMDAFVVTVIKNEADPMHT